MNFVEGEILYLNKPYRMSSFGALARVRYLISQKVGVKRVKTGHAGTLDPLATGVLILCTGRKTKEIERLQYHTKEYTATLQLGATTASYDMEHEVNATFPTEHKGTDRADPPSIHRRNPTGAASLLGMQGGRTQSLQANEKRG